MGSDRYCYHVTNPTPHQPMHNDENYVYSIELTHAIIIIIIITADVAEITLPTISQISFIASFIQNKLLLWGVISSTIMLPSDKCAKFLPHFSSIIRTYDCMHNFTVHNTGLARTGWSRMDGITMIITISCSHFYSILYRILNIKFWLLYILSTLSNFLYFLHFLLESPRTVYLPMEKIFYFFLQVLFD